MKRFALRLYIKHYRNNPSVRNFFALLSLDILVKAGMVVLIPIYTHVMSREDFGLFNYLFFYVSVVSLILNGGLYAAHTKLLNHPTECSKQAINGSIFLLFFGINLLIAAALFLTGLDRWVAFALFQNTNVNFEKYSYALHFAAFSYAIGFLLNNWLLSLKRIRLIQRSQLFKFLSHFPVLIALWTNLSQDAVLFRLWTFFALDFCINLIVLFTLWKEISWQFEPTLLKTIQRISLPIVVNAILGIVLNFFDKLYLQHSTHHAQMPSYTLATQLSSIIPIISLSFLSVMLPDFLKELDLEANYLHTLRTQKRLAALLVFFSGLIVSGTLAGLWMGIFPNTYGDSIGVLIILLAAKTIESLGQLFVRYTLYFERVWVGVLFSLFVSPMIIFLNAKWTIQYGMYASASVVFLAACLTYIYYRTYTAWEINRRQNALK